MSDKVKFDATVALEVALTLLSHLHSACARAVIAGSLRRMKPTVGDIEILYVPKFERRQDPVDMFAMIDVNRADEVIAWLERDKALERRKNVRGSETFGPKIKLMKHVETGIPVDLFQSTEAGWFSYLVCRTGPAESNVAICNAAIREGYTKWKPYEGLLLTNGDIRRVESEEELFKLVGLPYQPPEKRR